MNEAKITKLKEMRAENAGMITEAAALILLDELDNLRREKLNSTDSIDFIMRLACATVAEYAGIKSRADWTERLGNDETTLYAMDRKEAGVMFRG